MIHSIVCYISHYLSIFQVIYLTLPHDTEGGTIIISISPKEQTGIERGSKYNKQKNLASTQATGQLRVFTASLPFRVAGPPMNERKEHFLQTETDTLINACFSLELQFKAVSWVSHSKSW